jgi:hypothetical protein
MSALPASRDHCSPSRPTVNFSAAHFCYCQFETWLASDDAQALPEHQVEEETQRRGRELLRLLLQAHFHARGTGDVGPALQYQAAPLADLTTAPTAAAPATPPPPLRLADKHGHERTLKTIGGPIVIARTAYGAAGQDSLHPLDAQAALPAQSFSHPLQQRLVRAAVQGPYQEAIDNVALATGVAVSKGSCAQLVQAAATDFDAFYQHRPVPAPADTGSILMGSVDGKGVPMVKPEKTLRKLRLGKGEKRNKKRIATVATVRTQEPWTRTPEEVVASLFDAEPATPPLRVRREEHKRVWASLIQSKDEGIAEVVAEMQRCDPAKTKRWVALSDGERALQTRLETSLGAVMPSLVRILDFMHVLEKLWKAAHGFYAEGSDEAEAWVRQQALRLLRGAVRTVIRGMRRCASLRGLTGQRRATIEGVARYYERNVSRMAYDEYLRAGLPIASGAVEGACRHLVKDRLERTGMRWTLAGAEALLRLRAVYVSDDVTDYWAFHH